MRPVFSSFASSICAALLLTSWACSVEPIDLSGKACPCEEPFVCDDSRGVCVAPDAGLGGSAGTAGQAGSAGAGGTSGSGGAGGATGGVAGMGGSGGCLSTQKTCGGACVSKTNALYGCTTAGCDPCGSFENATATCKSSACAPLCKSGFGNCDGEASTGCEKPVADVANCGGCNRTCSTANTTSVACTAAKCAPSCAPGFGDCTTPASPSADNGCETSLASSKSHCGACGNSCYSGLLCSGRSCGCTTPSHCEGSTGVQNFSCNVTTRTCVCAGTTCVSGEVCIKDTGVNRCSCKGGVACGAGTVCCKAGCINLQTDPANCGGCGIACASDQSCAAGSCS